jgi:hypothetical protein
MAVAGHPVLEPVDPGAGACPGGRGSEDKGGGDRRGARERTSSVHDPGDDGYASRSPDGGGVRQTKGAGTNRGAL